LLRGERYQIWFLDDATGSGITLPAFLRKEKSRGPLAAIVLGKHKRGDTHPQDIKKLWPSMQTCVDQGYDLLIIRKNFRMLGDRIAEFKAGQIRAYCFLDGERIVITECCRKKKQKADKQVIARLETLRDEYSRRS